MAARCRQVWAMAHRERAAAAATLRELLASQRVSQLASQLASQRASQLASQRAWKAALGLWA